MVLSLRSSNPIMMLLVNNLFSFWGWKNCRPYFIYIKISTNVWPVFTNATLTATVTIRKDRIVARATMVTLVMDSTAQVSGTWKRLFLRAYFSPIHLTVSAVCAVSTISIRVIIKYHKLFILNCGTKSCSSNLIMI